MNNRLAGTCFVTIDGVSHSIVGEGAYKPSSVSRESQMGQDGYHGFKEMPMPGSISWKGRDSSSLSVSALNKATNVTVTMELASGKVVIGRNMVRVGDPIDVNTEDATFEVRFEGPEVTEN